jgi:hypothetical protein
VYTAEQYLGIAVSKVQYKSVAIYKDIINVPVDPGHACPINVIALFVVVEPLYYEKTYLHKALKYFSVVLGVTVESIEVIALE